MQSRSSNCSSRACTRWTSHYPAPVKDTFFFLVRSLLNSEIIDRPLIYLCTQYWVQALGELYSAANDPQIGPQMIPRLDRKWSRTSNDPRYGPQMIPPTNEEWHGVWFPGFCYFLLIFIYLFSSTKRWIRSIQRKDIPETYTIISI